jgi:hypothetical protein
MRGNQVEIEIREITAELKPDEFTHFQDAIAVWP